VVAEVDEKAALQLVDFKLPPPKELSSDDQDHLIENAVYRIWTGAEELMAGESMTDLPPVGGSLSTELWMLLIVRMVTRVTEPPLDEMDETDAAAKKVSEEGTDNELNFYARQDRLRQTLCDYIMSDFTAR
jgi:symplekin